MKNSEQFFTIERLESWMLDGFPSRTEQIMFVDVCCEYVREKKELPLHWQHYSIYLNKKAVQAVLKDKSARDSKIARAMGLSKPELLTGRNMVIAVGVHRKEIHDEEPGAVDRAIRHVVDHFYRVKYPEVTASYSTVRNCYYQHRDQLDGLLPLYEKLARENPDALFGHAELFLD